MRRIVVGLAAITALLSGMVGPATASTASQAATTCPVVQVFGVRGSGETAGGPYNGFGKTVQDVFAHFQTTAETSYLVSVDGTAIDYPAVGVGFGLQYYAQLYRESETAGVAALEAAIRKFNRSCGNQSVILLIGYSQGAQVVGDAFVGIGATQ